MDWVDEKMETFRIWIRNLPIKKALIAYLCIAAVAALLLSFATTGLRAVDGHPGRAKCFGYGLYVRQ